MQRDPLPSLAASVENRAMFARMPSVLRFTGLGRSTIYRMIAAREFPGPVKLGSRAVGWRWSELDTWSATRPHRTQ